MKYTIHKWWWSLLIIGVLIVSVATVSAQGGGVGAAPQEEEAESRQRVPTNISPLVTERGLISLSVDGLGTLKDSGTIQVEKPAGATVRKAYLAAASTGFTQRVLADGEVKINGVDVLWDASTPSNINSSNHWADVTSIIKPSIDAAPAGRVDLSITEVDSDGIDGELIAVIFDDPNQTSQNTIVLLFGAQNVDGDTFAIGLGEAIDLSDPNLVLDMSLGISFGCQGTPSDCTVEAQFSQVDVNGNRMTSAAGGADEGELEDGALFTVGGLDDNNDNPADPNAPPVDSRSDDELYNLIPFVSNGDSSINVFTTNPSDDDNILFASLFLGGTTAVVGEGVVIAPNSGTACIDQDSYTVTATLQNNLGEPIAEREVTFEVVTGPHTGTTQMATTNANGQATFTYAGTSQGTDTVRVTFVNEASQPISSNDVTVVWEDCDPTSITLAELTTNRTWPSTVVPVSLVALLMLFGLARNVPHHPS